MNTANELQQALEALHEALTKPGAFEALTHEQLRHLEIIGAAAAAEARDRQIPQAA